MAVQDVRTEQAPISRDAQQIATWLLLAVLVTIPLHVGEILWASPGGDGDPNRRVAAYAYDLPLFLLVVVAAADAIERIRSGHAVRWQLPGCFAAAAGAWYVLASLVQPSWRALDLLFHVAGAWAIGRTVVQASTSGRRLILTALVVFGGMQAVLGVTQSRLGEIAGIPYIEWNAQLLEFGGVAAARGSLTHPYHLATVLLVCLGAAVLLVRNRFPRAHQTAVLAAVMLISVALPLTFSRAAALAMALVIVLLSFVRHLRPRALPLVILGLLIGLLLAAGGVSAKIEKTTSAHFDSGRRTLASEAASTSADSPLFGVGPGRIAVDRAASNPGSTPVLPHNLLLHAAAEAGVVAAGLLAGAAVTGAIGVIRSGTLPGLVAAGPAPFFLVDAFPYAFGTGLVFTGLWLGTVVIACRGEGPPP